MQLDVAYLRDFYATPLGLVVRRLLSSRIRAGFARAPAGTLIGLGYATPYLGALRGEVRRLGAFMPAGQGALVWPRSGDTLSVLVEEDRLPIADNSVDRLIAVHCLEVAERTAPLLREMWRVLAPEGRLLIVVPNRRGMWTRLDTTPFGHGQPYSRRQLDHLLKDALFTPVEWSTALHVPPFDKRLLLRVAHAWERAGTRLWPAFGGVLVVEASKEVAAPVGKAVKVRTIPDLAGVRRKPLVVEPRKDSEEPG